MSAATLRGIDRVAIDVDDVSAELVVAMQRFGDGDLLTTRWHLVNARERLNVALRRIKRPSAR